MTTKGAALESPEGSEGGPTISSLPSVLTATIDDGGDRDDAAALALL